ncbi:MAG: phosphoribosyltransferase family protein [Gemmatimonadaceae bacterium]
MGVGTGSEIVHAFKYGGWQRAGAQIARRMARVSWPVDVVSERTATIAVPLAIPRERERGFNQSAVLSTELAAIWGIPAWNDAVVRTRSTRSQTELTPGERQGNVAGAFRVRPERQASLAGAHIILVDDVITTGATLRACSRALFHSGARIISYMTFGRAPASGDRIPK